MKSHSAKSPNLCVLKDLLSPHPKFKMVSTFWATWIFKIFKKHCGGDTDLSEKMLNESGQILADKHKSSPLVVALFVLAMSLQAQGGHGSGGLEWKLVIHPLWHSLQGHFSPWVMLLTTKILASPLFHKSSPVWFSYWATSWVQRQHLYSLFFNNMKGTPA